jgi:hypothetical protein
VKGMIPLTNIIPAIIIIKDEERIAMERKMFLAIRSIINPFLELFF